MSAGAVAHLPLTSLDDHAWDDLLSFIEATIRALGEVRQWRERIRAAG